MEERVTQIMAHVFNISLDEIGEDASSESIENWDSVTHITLVQAIEEEFDIEIDEQEIAEVMDKQALLRAVNGKLDVT